MNRLEFYTAREITPQGWMARQLRIQADGLCGHLDKVWPDIRDSRWIGGKAEGWERVPYWLDGFIPLAYLLRDEGLIARAKRYVDAILAARQEDGWICPCTNEQRPKYDTWAVMLISKTLTVYYECSGDERIPGVIERVLRNYYDLLRAGTIRLFGWGKFRWFECFVAIRFLVRRKDEPWLHDLARILQEQGADYAQAVPLWQEPSNERHMETHIVNLAMMMKHEAISHDILGQPYTARVDGLVDTLDKLHGRPFGLWSGDEHLGGVSPVRGTELCAVVEAMYSCEHLYAVTGEEKWLERLELLAFNALPAAMSEDTWAHQYDQQTNQIACKTQNPPGVFGTNSPDAHIFGLEPHFGCCTANFGQGWPKLMLSAWLHRPGEIVSAIALPSRLETEALSACLDTEYPFRPAVTYTLRARQNVRFTVRIPAFARNLRVNGERIEGPVSLELAAGEERILHIAFDVQPAFRPTSSGMECVQWGSLLFSVPVDFAAEMHEYTRGGVERKFPYCDYAYIPQSEWAFRFASARLTVRPGQLGPMPFAVHQPPVTVETDMQPIDWGFAAGQDTVCAPLPANTAPTGPMRPMALIPYGCAKLRMTELPRG